MDPVVLITQLLGGAAGGNIAGSLFKNTSLGGVGNTLAGVVGGLLGGNIVATALQIGKAAADSGLDIGAIVTQIAGSGVGGGVMMVLVGLLRQIFAKA